MEKRSVKDLGWGRILGMGKGNSTGMVMGCPMGTDWRRAMARSGIPREWVPATRTEQARESRRR